LKWAEIGDTNCKENLNATVAHHLNISSYRTYLKTNEEEQTRIRPAGKPVIFSLPLLGDIAAVHVFRPQATGFHHTSENLRVCK
jgi:hypothetical protein